LTAEGEEPVAATIASIDGNSITTNPPAANYQKGSLIIRGNVVLAGHGEVKPEKILGSGDAAKSNQEFTLKVDQVSFTPDATMSSGVAAAIEVEVAGQVWEQVSTLKDSAPGDHHYAIRMTEEGYVKILFGDGQYGRRLPSGKNNLRVRYRVGTGLAGNVPAAGLVKPVNPHPAVDSVQQPLKAAGGGDMEDVTSLRENAPPTVLALERAVSLSDFSHLAAAQSNVWQARAYNQTLHGGKKESVRVVVVPAGGGQSPEIRKAIQTFLQKHTLPGVQVTVEPFVEKRFSLSIAVRFKAEEFLAEEVEQTVTAALVEHFAIGNRKLGEHLYLSEVIKIVEGVQGVENSICVMTDIEIVEGVENYTCIRNEEEGLQLIEAKNDSTVVYLDTEAEKCPSVLTVTLEEYQP
jgi:predicted phage baseplate assembly protein